VWNVENGDGQGKQENKAVPSYPQNYAKKRGVKDGRGKSTFDH